MTKVWQTCCPREVALELKRRINNDLKWKVDKLYYTLVITQVRIKTGETTTAVHPNRRKDQTKTCETNHIECTTSVHKNTQGLRLCDNATVNLWHLSWRHIKAKRDTSCQPKRTIGWQLNLMILDEIKVNNRIQQ